MSVTCQKDVIVNVKAATPISELYWTLDESGVATARVDKVQAIALNPNGTNVMDAQPGLFSNGLAFVEKGVAQSNISNTASPLVAYSSANGWSWWFWFKVVNWAAPTSWNQPPILLWGDSGLGPGLGWRISVNWDPDDIQLFCQTGLQPQTVGVQFSDNNLNIYCAPALAVPLGSWVFIHVFYDPVAAKVGYQVNNGAPLYGVQNGGPPASPQFTTPTKNGVLNFSQRWLLADTPTIATVIDEMGFKLSRILTPTELAFIYNGGAGRTWPV